MAAVRFLAGLALAALLHAGGTALWSGFALIADPFLVAAVAVALSGRAERALVAGTLAGWTADALAGGPFGLYGLADGAVAYATALVAQRLVVDRRSSAAGVFAAAAAAQGALLVALGVVFRGPAETLTPLELVLRVAVAAALGLAWMQTARWTSARWRRRGSPKSGGVTLPKSLLR
jgi:cell shape-determining protein MreD